MTTWMFVKTPLLLDRQNPKNHFHITVLSLLKINVLPKSYKYALENEVLKTKTIHLKTWGLELTIDQPS